MELPIIELASLPILDNATALFGSITAGKAETDDRIVAIMVYVYDVT